MSGGLRPPYAASVTIQGWAEPTLRALLVHGLNSRPSLGRGVSPKGRATVFKLPSPFGRRVGDEGAMCRIAVGSNHLRINGTRHPMILFKSWYGWKSKASAAASGIGKKK